MIAIHVAMIIIPNIFLNHPLLLLIIWSLLINTLPNSAINPTANPNQREYNIILMVPCRRDNGNIVAIISVYVGEQVVNMGPNDAHRIICHQILWDSFGQDRVLICNTDLHCSRNSGNIFIIQNSINMVPEIVFHTCWSIDIKTVDTFNKKVNAMIDMTNDRIIVIILL
jgi:acyl-CoA synthetase (AMP-forming)/AMP-acid ligase II